MMAEPITVENLKRLSDAEDAWRALHAVAVKPPTLPPKPTAGAPSTSLHRSD